MPVDRAPGPHLRASSVSVFTKVTFRIFLLKDESSPPPPPFPHTSGHTRLGALRMPERNLLSGEVKSQAFPRSGEDLLCSVLRGTVKINRWVVPSVCWDLAAHYGTDDQFGFADPLLPLRASSAHKTSSLKQKSEHAKIPARTREAVVAQQEQTMKGVDIKMAPDRLTC